jgi:penicillin amidase/acyl-homoserine-lactone acylase
MRDFGRLDPLWSARNRLIRGAADLPLGGGPDVLRAIYALPEPDGRLKAVAGDGLIVYTAWDKNGKQSGAMVHNFGAASTRPQSPHYADQAPLYAAEQLRPIALTRDALVKTQHTITRLPLD